MVTGHVESSVVGVAQLVERRIVIPVVVGSNPIVHPILPSLIYLLTATIRSRAVQCFIPG